MQKLHVACVDPATGQSRANASVRVTIGLTANLAAIYADDEVTPLPNPLTADTAGRTAFKVVDGEYDIEVSGVGFTPYKITLVQAMDKDKYATKQDLANLSQGAVTQGSLTYVDAKLEYGAKGDGVTDDQPAIQAAINSRKGPVYLRPGTYKIGQALTLLDSTKLIGAGTKLTIIRPSGTSYPALFANTATFVTAEDLTVQSPVSSGHGTNGIHFANVNELFLSRIEIVGHFKAGVYLDHCSQGQLLTVFSRLVDNGYQMVACTVINMYNCAALNVNSVGLMLASTCAYLTIIAFNAQEFQIAGVYVSGTLYSAMILNSLFGNTVMRGKWLLADTALTKCWFIGISLGNTADMQVPAASDYWLMLDTAMKTNTGTIWSPSAIRAWGHLSTTGFVGNTHGILSVTHTAVGKARVTWKTPAIFVGDSYAVNLTSNNASDNWATAQIVAIDDLYVDVSFLAGTALYVEQPFFISAGGKVVV